MDKKERLILIIAIIVLILICVFLNKIKKIDPSYDLKIYFFNAGKADAILIEKNNKYIMLDTGEESLSQEILDYFKKNNIKKLDYLIITHFDKDHVGSASNVIDNIEIGEVLQSNYIKESEYYNNYIKSLSNKKITPITVSGDYDIELDDLKIVVNGSEKIYDSNESNNSSLIVSINYNKNNFLFMGDSQNARIKDFLNNNDETYDFLKVPYHGNYLKRLDTLLEEKNIKYAVITSSNKELESEETISMLNKYNIKYFLTRKGSITIYSNGNEIKIRQ